MQWLVVAMIPVSILGSALLAITDMGDIVC